MSAPGGMFCEHKRLRTSCPSCKPPPPPPPAPKAKAPRAPATPREAAAEEPETFRPTGPGKPLMPTRKPKNRSVSRAEAETADAWWVKKK